MNNQIPPPSAESIILQTIEENIELFEYQLFYPAEKIEKTVKLINKIVDTEKKDEFKNQLFKNAKKNLEKLIKTIEEENEENTAVEAQNIITILEEQGENVDSLKERCKTAMNITGPRNYINNKLEKTETFNPTWRYDKINQMLEKHKEIFPDSEINEFKTKLKKFGIDSLKLLITELKNNQKLTSRSLEANLSEIRNLIEKLKNDRNITDKEAGKFLQEIQPFAELQEKVDQLSN